MLFQYTGHVWFFSSGCKIVSDSAFIPKLLGSCYPIDLVSFYPPQFSSKQHQLLSLLCMVSTLCSYVYTTKACRTSISFFCLGQITISGYQFLTCGFLNWVVVAIALAMGLVPLTVWVLTPPGTFQATGSWSEGLSIKEICAVAIWSSPHTFAMFHRIDVTALALAHSVVIFFKYITTAQQSRSVYIPIADTKWMLWKRTLRNPSSLSSKSECLVWPPFLLLCSEEEVGFGFWIRSGSVLKFVREGRFQPSMTLLPLVSGNPGWWNITGASNEVMPEAFPMWVIQSCYYKQGLNT